MFILKWTNKYSGETGYVASVSSKEQHFNNTYDKEEAKRYQSESSVKRIITCLTAMGEADNNVFEAVSV